MDIHIRSYDEENTHRYISDATADGAPWDDDYVPLLSNDAPPGTSSPDTTSPQG
jgi:hypothetical protein